MNIAIYPGPEYAQDLQETLAVGSSESESCRNQRLIAFLVAQAAYKADPSHNNRSHYSEMGQILGRYIDDNIHWLRYVA